MLEYPQVLVKFVGGPANHKKGSSNVGNATFVWIATNGVPCLYSEWEGQSLPRYKFRNMDEDHRVYAYDGVGNE